MTNILAEFTGLNKAAAASVKLGFRQTLIGVNS